MVPFSPRELEFIQDFIDEVLVREIQFAVDVAEGQREREEQAKRDFREPPVAAFIEVIAHGADWCGSKFTEEQGEQLGDAMRAFYEVIKTESENDDQHI